MKKQVLSLLLLLAALTAGAQSFTGTFTQAKTLKAAKKVIKSQGEIVFTMPDQLAMNYTQPEGDFFVIDGPFVRLDMRGTALDVDSRTNKTIAQQRNALINSLSGKYEDIAREMDATCEVSAGKNGGKHVVIKVKKPMPKGYSGLELDYRKDGILTRMVLEEFGGISTEYLLTVK